MNSKQVFDKYNSRLKAEAVVKSLLCGLAVGLGVAAVLTFIFWLTDFEYFWIGAIIGAVLIGVGTPLFYKFMFKPTVRTAAHRMDSLGLEERVLTMTELAGDNSYIAQRQREDAQAALSSLSSSSENKTVVRMPMRIPAWNIAVASVVAVLFGAVQIVSILSFNGSIPKASEIVDNINPSEVVYHTVTFLTEGDGNIDGDTDQVIADGESADPVIAIAEDGYFFVGWVDGELVEQLGWPGIMMGVSMGIIELDDNPELECTNVYKDSVVYAWFYEMSEDNDGEGDGDGDGEGEPGDGESGAGDSGEPNGGGSDGDGDGEGDNNSGGEGNGNGASGGDSLQDNTFLDGNTPIKDYYDEYYQEAMKLLAEGKELPDDLRKIIEDYYGGIKP